MNLDNRAKILIVAKDLNKLTSTINQLKKADLASIVSTLPNNVVELLSTTVFAAILLDSDVLTLESLAIAQLIRSQPRAQATPIIVIGSDPSRLPEAFDSLYDLGRIDFIYQPLIINVLLAKISFCVELFIKTEELRQRDLDIADINRKNERIRLILDNAKDYAFIVTDLDGKIMVWEGGAELITQWQADDVTGRPIDIVFTPEDLASQRPYKEQMLAKETGRCEDKRWHVRKNGARFYADGVTVALKDPAGQLVGLAKIFRDATIEHQIGTALRLSEEKFSLLLNSSAAGIFGMGPDTRCIFANTAGATMLGYTPGELVGRSLHELIHHHCVDGSIYPLGDCRIANAARAGAPINVEDEVFWHKDGTPIPVSYQVSPMMGETGSSSVVITFTDISERRRNEELLRDAQTRLEANLSAGEVATWIFDIPSNKVTADRNLAKLFSVSEAIANGGPIEEYLKAIHPEDVDQTIAVIKHAIATGAPFDANYRICTLNGEYRYVSARGKVEYDERGKPIRLPGVIVDVTQQKQIEQELQAREETLRQLAADLSEANQRKTEFLATLAHELRNPLAPIRTGLSVIEVALHDPITIGRVRDMMERQVTHMVHLVDDLLDVARIVSNKIALQKQQVDFKTLVTSAIETALPHIEGRQHELIVNIPDQQINIEVDPTRINQVLSNLLHNAAKYTPQGGRICLTVQINPNELIINITDTGVGIAEAFLPHIFDMFTQVGRDVGRADGGLGIGLSLVYRIVELHNGKIDVTSPGLGKGSSFVISLPYTAALATKPPGETEKLEVPESSINRVLVVDDNMDAATSLTNLLSLCGYETRTAFDGSQALQLITSFQPDIAFIDIGMPGMSGYELAVILREMPDLQSMQLVALTGWGTEKDRARSAEAGFNQHLTKPVDFTTLKRVLSI